MAIMMQLGNFFTFVRFSSACSFSSFLFFFFFFFFFLENSSIESDDREIVEGRSTACILVTDWRQRLAASRQPDRPFHNFGVSKYVARHSWTASPDLEALKLWKGRSGSEQASNFFLALFYSWLPRRKYTLAVRLTTSERASLNGMLSKFPFLTTH